MRKVTVWMALFFVAVAGTAFAQTSQILHVSGQTWETGGFPPSNPGDGMNMVGVLNDIDYPLVWDTANYSYTMHVRQLTAIGEVNVGGSRLASYTGGLFSIYVDWLPSNHNYGVNPPNATSPGTFSDGISTYLDGYFTGFSLSFNDVTQSGSFSGTLNFTGGDVFPLLNATTGWTFGANLAGVSPTGYDLQVNGDVYLTVVGVEQETWGGIKALYR
jgi:hypothetical protein